MTTVESQCQKYSRQRDEDEENILGRGHLSGNSSQISQGTPLIRIRPIEDLRTPPSSSVSIASIFPSTQKRKAQTQSRPCTSSPIKRPRSINKSPIKRPRSINKSPIKRPRSINKRSSPVRIVFVPSIKNGKTPNQSKSRRNKNQPTAENSGMKPNALLKYFSTMNVESNPVTSPRRTASADPKPSTLRQPTGPVENNPPIARLEVNQSPPRIFPQTLYNTPSKNRSETEARTLSLNTHISSITITPCPRAPPKTASPKRPSQETTPQPDLPDPNLNSVRKQLDFSICIVQQEQDKLPSRTVSNIISPAKPNVKSRGAPPPKIDVEKNLARLAAFRERQYDSSETDSAKENVIVPREQHKRKKKKQSAAAANQSEQPTAAVVPLSELETQAVRATIVDPEPGSTTTVDPLPEQEPQTAMLLLQRQAKTSTNVIANAKFKADPQYNEKRKKVIKKKQTGKTSASRQLAVRVTPIMTISALERPRCTIGGGGGENELLSGENGTVTKNNSADVGIQPSLKVVTGSGPKLQRRSSHCGSSSDGTLVRRKSVDVGIPPILVKVLKKKFGDEMSYLFDWNRSEESHVLIEMKSEHASFLLERCAKFHKFEGCTIATPSISLEELKKISKSEQVETFQFFMKEINNIVEDKERGASRRRVELTSQLLETLQKLYNNLGRPNPINCYFLCLMDLFRQPVEQCRRRLKEDEALKLACSFVTLLEVTYDEYMSGGVKLNFPMIADLFQGIDPSENPNIQKRNVLENFGKLIDLIFSFDEKSKEFQLLLKIFNLAIAYFSFVREGFSFCHRGEKELLNVFWNAIVLRQGDWGIELMKRIERPTFGKGICQRILTQRLNLYDQKTQEQERMAVVQQKLDLLLAFIANSSVVLERVPVDYDHGSKGIEEMHTNLTGESLFHRACALPPTNVKGQSRKVEETKIQYLEQLLDKLLDIEGDDPVGDINAVDNNGNTCLHDAAQNGRLDAIKLLAEKCWNPRRLPSRTNLDILAQDLHGNTSLHIALSSMKIKIQGGAGMELLERKLDVVKFLVGMTAKAPKKLQILFATKNNLGESVFDFGVPQNSISDNCMEFLHLSLTQVVIDLDTLASSAPVPISTATLFEIQNSPDLQQIIAYWEFFNNKLLPLA